MYLAGPKANACGWESVVNALAAFLRAVNVGGTGKLPMLELKAICDQLGFQHAKTYIQSGNVVFRSNGSEHETRRRLEAALATHAGHPIDVIIRTPEELAQILAANPFQGADGSKVAVLLGNAILPASVMAGVEAPDGEEVVAAKRELYVHYPNGMGRSRLKLPKLEAVTARNINTLNKVLQLAQELDDDR